MTQKQRIEELERKIAELETRLAVHEAQPFYFYWQVPPVQPQPYTQPFWTTTRVNCLTYDNNTGGI